MIHVTISGFGVYLFRHYRRLSIYRGDIEHSQLGIAKVRDMGNDIDIYSTFSL
jgi:hypothetical protein